MRISKFLSKDHRWNQSSLFLYCISLHFRFIIRFQLKQTQKFLSEMKWFHFLAGNYVVHSIHLLEIHIIIVCMYKAKCKQSRKNSYKAH